MALDISQHLLDRTDLVVLVGHDGLVEWSAKRSREEVAAMLRSIADDIEDETL
jgi:ribosomal protein S24E